MKNREIFKVRKTNAFLLFVYFFVSLFAFFWIFKYNFSTDLWTHIYLYMDILANDKIPMPPMYYWTIGLVDKFVSFRYPFVFAAILVLGVASLAKYYLSLVYLTSQKITFKLHSCFSGILVFGLMFFFPIYVYGFEELYWYLGKFTPNVWHNSTTIFVFPFSIALFLVSLKWIESPKQKWWWAQLLLGGLVLSIKPSFLFVFIPALPLIDLLKRKRVDQYFGASLLLSGVLLGGVLFQKYLIFYQNSFTDQVFGVSGKSEIILAPFEVWEFYVENKFQDLATSFIFLFAGIFLMGRRLWKDWHFQYAMLMVLGAVFIYFLIAESGSRMMDANFYWQIPISLFILYLVMVKHLLLEIQSLPKIKDLSRKSIVLIFFYSLHVGSGVLYLIRLLWLDKYQ